MNLLRGIVGITKAVAGIGAATEEEQKRRYSQCISCPRDARGVCGECGCLIAMKIKNANEACPIGRWLPEKIAPPEPALAVGNVPLPQFKHRISLCHACERMTPEGNCGDGAAVALLASHINVGCPLRRWETLPPAELPPSVAASLDQLATEAI